MGFWLKINSPLFVHWLRDRTQRLPSQYQHLSAVYWRSSKLMLHELVLNLSGEFMQ
jgi:hypothetical protein